MTEQQHTKEPWSYHKDTGVIAPNVTGGDMTDADASRIVACVNACEGLSDDFLEFIAHKKVKPDLESVALLCWRMKQQRDELDDICRRYARHEKLCAVIGGHDYCSCGLDEALAKARDGK